MQLFGPNPMVLLHAEAARRRSSFHRHPLPCQMLADHHINSIKPPVRELDGPAVEPDHTHHVLIGEVKALLASKTSILFAVFPTVSILVISIQECSKINKPVGNY